MIYAVSDIHGCYGKYLRLIESIDLRPEDTLYVLGDVVDRGEQGIDILLDMQKRKNIVPLRGNHDFIALRYLRAMELPYDGEEVWELADNCRMWLADGGAPTLEAYIRLSDREKRGVLSYLRSFSVYEEVEAGGNRFFLSHTVPDKKRMQSFDTLLWQEFIVGEPEYDEEYFPDRYIVTGHTPTGLIDPASSGRIFRHKRHIAIDCGAVFGKPLGCIRLDDFKEFYVD